MDIVNLIRIGRYGFLAVLVVFSALNYEKDTFLFGLMIVLSFVVFLIMVGVELYHNDRLLKMKEHGG